VFERYGTLFEASRTALDQTFGEPKSLSGLLTKAGLDRPRGYYLTPDGLTLYFSARPKSDTKGTRRDCITSVESIAMPPGRLRPKWRAFRSRATA